MGKQRSIGLGIVFLMVVFLVVGLSGTALAANSTPQGDGNSTMVGDPVGADNAPHGGFSSGTDYCLQCHKQHGTYDGAPAYGMYGTGAFALMRNESVTATCQTCHELFGSATGRYDPGIGAGAIGTAATRAAYQNGNPNGSATDPHKSVTAGDCTPYDSTTTKPAGMANCTTPYVPSAGVDDVWGHKIGYGVATLGIGTVTDNYDNTSTRYASGYDIQAWAGLGTTPPANSTTKSGAGSASGVAGGFYCGSCHSPHGADYGNAVNTEKNAAWTDGATIAWENITGGFAAGVPGPVAGVPQWGNVKLFADSADTLGGGYGWAVCATTSASVADPTCTDAIAHDAQGDDVSLYAYKLLTSGPNHQYTGRESTNPYLCSNGLPGSTGGVTTAADCAAIYGSSVTANYTVTNNGPQSYKIEMFNEDGAKWCGTCHTYNLDTELGGAVHAHPTGCDACHGNPDGGPAAQADFPHSTVEESMLKELPDGLCITCHTNLP